MKALDVVPLPPADPHRGVRVFSDYRGPVRDACDVLVIGSGPGGAIVAKELAERGKDVVLLEEGPPFGAKDMRQEAHESLRRTMREAGTRTTRGSVFMPTIQAIALGGGSLVNSAISCRAPDWALDGWAERHGLASLGGGSLDAHYTAVEQFLGIAPTPDEVLGERNRLFKRGCDALGWSSEPTPRNVRQCKGSAECFTGCRNGAKQSMDVSYVPAAIRAGARVYTSVRAEHLTGDTRRVDGVRGHVVEPFTGRASHEARFDAKCVVLAAGCMQTPVIVQRSGIGNRSGQVGNHLHAHPGLTIMGIYPHRVEPWQGATQGFHSLEFLREGMKLEVLWGPPALLAMRFPGFGLEFKEHLLAYDRMASFDVFVAAHRSTGRVRAPLFGWNPRIDFEIHPEDMALLQKGLCRLVELSFAAGAERVLPGIHGVPDVLTPATGVGPLANAKVAPRDTTVGATHLFGTTRMGTDPRTSVTDAWGKFHEVDNLYAADTGLFPDSTAVNPMLTCMALAHRIAGGIADRSLG